MASVQVAAAARDDVAPVGRQIAFVSRRDGRYGMYLMKPDGSGQRLLTRADG